MRKVRCVPFFSLGAMNLNDCKPEVDLDSRKMNAYSVREVANHLDAVRILS